MTPTAGGVVFFGDMGGNFYAVDAKTAETLGPQDRRRDRRRRDHLHGRRRPEDRGGHRLTEMLWPTEITTAKVVDPRARPAITMATTSPGNRDASWSCRAAGRCVDHIGAFQALREHAFEPDWVCGISMGAINGAITAGNAPERRLEQLETFWESISWPALSWPALPSRMPWPGGLQMRP